MTSGGRRNRSGPAPDPDSGRSEERGYSLEFLPPSGYDGPVPTWPLPEASARELALWTRAWRTPQACAWSLPSERWRSDTVAMWVRLKARCEQPDAGAALMSQMHRFADQIGMTTAGLREMGWRIAAVTKASAGSTAPDAPTDEVHERRKRRLRGSSQEIG